MLAYAVRRSFNLRRLIIVALLFMVTTIGCGVKPYKHVAPTFESFEMEYSSVCVDRETPIFVSVTWEVDPGSVSSEEYYDHCVYISANAERVDNVQCLDQGLTGGTSFTLSSLFGTNIPTPVTVLAELCSGIQCAVVNDSASGSVPTQICGDSDTTP